MVKHEKRTVGDACDRYRGHVQQRHQNRRPQGCRSESTNRDEAPGLRRCVIVCSGGGVGRGGIGLGGVVRGGGTRAPGLGRRSTPCDAASHRGGCNERRRRSAGGPRGPRGRCKPFWSRKQRLSAPDGRVMRSARLRRVGSLSVRCRSGKDTFAHFGRPCEVPCGNTSDRAPMLSRRMRCVRQERPIQVSQARSDWTRVRRRRDGCGVVCVFWCCVLVTQSGKRGHSTPT